MRLDTKDRQLDLVVVGVMSSLLLFIILLLDVAWLRVLLGLPFVLFFPGYSLVSALFPRQDRPSSFLKKKPMQENTDLDMLERVALSFGLSIAVVPLIGLLLNLTYSWGAWWGIRLYPVMLSVYLFIVISSTVAVVRRLRLPPDERFNIRIDVKMPKDMTTVDKAMAVGIAVMLLASIVLIGYIIVVPREGEPFTEISLLESNDQNSKYLENISANSMHNITIRVVNHEHTDMNYTLVILLIPASETSMTEHTFSNLTWNAKAPILFSVKDAVILNITVKEDKNLDLNMTIGIRVPGQYKLLFLLFTSSEPTGNTVDAGDSYRYMRLLVQVN